MRAALHTLIAALMQPGHVRVRDQVAFWATCHLPLVARLRARWHDRQGRPGFRAWE